MNHFRILVLFLSLITPSIWADQLGKQIKAVENGLLPANVFKGDKPWTLHERMKNYGVPGVGIAVIQDHKVVWFKTYGLADRETGKIANNKTLFQAGSVSKPFAAFGALQLVEAGKLSLDADVNSFLKSWKLPNNKFTAQAKVTLRHLLSHTGGVSVHGFGGYAEGKKVPTVLQVLEGSGPANSSPVRVDKLPGEGFRYSGGGYTIAQLMMSDVTGKQFDDLLNEMLIKPLRMMQSTYNQPLPPNLLKHAAAGVLPDGVAVPGKRHIYPEMAAAGLWTTANDLALFTIEMQKALNGESQLISKSMAETMATPVDAGYGLGWGISKRGGSSYFSHGGWDEGFSSQLTSHMNNGDGVVVMINSNHPAFINEVVNAVAHTYSWDGYAVNEILAIPEELISKYTGRYRYNASSSISITHQQGKLFMRYAGEKANELLYTGDGLFMRRERTTPIIFTNNDDALQLNFVLGDGTYRPHIRLDKNVHLAADILEKGIYADALTVYEKLLTESPSEASVSEGYLNNTGLSSMKDNSVYAIKILTMNTDLYPDSANTWDSLALAYQESGNIDKAIEHYHNALKRDPKFASALKGVADLENKKAQSK
ncbi:hypothetical protein CXF85_19765 [Colwellia sp. 75C3]|uniref:serine hydrolase n=1 Tax=Colwellia sp. 75C3 TaxID=888425 RepID=UPI000C346C2C|nr:serine hydrolase [Colwellia sp. 75C3]PKG81004.1 hypothetical protein CXF85_19765 [Colwellia sp. 75C3]